MAVRGLGCPVRFALTAGQKGDAPQADALIEGLPADIVMADTAYDSDRLRDAIAEKGAVAVIPNNPSRARNTRWTKTSMSSATSSNAASQSSNISAGSQRASRKQHETISQSSQSQLSSYGSDKCPHDLLHNSLNRNRFRVKIMQQFQFLKYPF